MKFFYTQLQSLGLEKQKTKDRNNAKRKEISEGCKQQNFLKNIEEEGPNWRNLLEIVEWDRNGPQAFKTILFL